MSDDSPNFSSRVERRFGLDGAGAPILAAAIAAHVPVDPHYAIRQPVRTVYVQPIEDDADSRDETIRIRTYLAAPGTPTFLERKRWKDDQRTKERIAVDASTHVQLLAGHDPHQVLGVSMRTEEHEREIAKAVAGLLADGGWGARVRTDYHRLAWEADDGSVRMTLDVMLSHHGFADLAPAGTRVRDGAVLECKTTEDPPAWLDALLEHSGDALEELPKGKGATARRDLHAAIEALGIDQ